MRVALTAKGAAAGNLPRRPADGNRC